MTIKIKTAKVKAHPLKGILGRFVFLVIYDGVNKSKRVINSILTQIENRRLCPYVSECRRKARETYEHQKQNALAGFSNGGLLPYGYQRHKVEIIEATGIKKEKLSWQINPATAPAVALAFELHQQGTSCRQIAEILNQKGYRTQKDNLFPGATVASWFRNLFPFAGVMIWGRHNKKRQVTAEEEWVQ